MTYSYLLFCYCIFFCGLLGQKFIFFQTIAFPLLSLVGSLFIWISVKNLNIVRRSIGIGLMIWFICATLLRNFGFSQSIAELVAYPILLLFMFELIRVARNNLKILYFLLLILPLAVLSVGENFSNVQQQWFFLLAFPVIWIPFSLYANAHVFKRAARYAGFTLFSLLILIYLAIDLVSLGFIEQLMKEPAVKEFFGSTQTVPILHLYFTVFFVPSVITCLICYIIADRRSKRIPLE